MTNDQRPVANEDTRAEGTAPIGRSSLGTGRYLSLLVPTMAAVAVGVAWLVLDVAMPAARLSNAREATVFLWRDIPESVEHMIRGNDPALFSPAILNDRSVWELSPTRYTPSWENGLPELRPLPSAAVSPVSSWPALFAHTAPAVTAVPPVKEPPAPTKIVFSEALAVRNPSVPKFAHEGERALPPMEFLVAVRDDGRVAHVFPLNSTAATSALEEAVAKLLYASEFSEQLSRGSGEPGGPGGSSDGRGEATQALLTAHCSLLTPLTWGTVTFLWGNDQ